MKRFVSSRLLHFFSIGLVIYFLINAYSRQQQRYVLCLTDSKLNVLAEDWAKNTGRAVRPDELAHLADAALDEQILVKEAMLQGLHKSDPVILQRLLRDADFLGVEGSAKDKIEAVLSLDIAASDEVVRRRLIQVLQYNVWSSEKDNPPTDTDLKTIYSQHKELGVIPRRISFEHVYFNTQDNKPSAGDVIIDDANARAARRVQLGVESVDQGDVFLSGNEFFNMTPLAITSIFGEEFSQSLSDGDLPLGKWSGPLESQFGSHAVRILSREDAYRLSFLSLRSELEDIWQEETKAKRWEQYVQQLRGRYREVCHANK